MPSIPGPDQEVGRLQPLTILFVDDCPVQSLIHELLSPLLLPEWLYHSCYASREPCSRSVGPLWSSVGSVAKSNSAAKSQAFIIRLSSKILRGGWWHIVHLRRIRIRVYVNGIKVGDCVRWCFSGDNRNISENIRKSVSFSRSFMWLVLRKS